MSLYSDYRERLIQYEEKLKQMRENKPTPPTVVVGELRITPFLEGDVQVCKDGFSTLVIPVDLLSDLYKALGLLLDDQPEGNGKLCKISNYADSWVLEVDGKMMYFIGLSLAKYFKELHEKAGYTVLFEPRKFMNTQRKS
jgi:hypothetical protein